MFARLAFAPDELVVVLNPHPERDRGRFHRRSRRDSYWKGVVVPKNWTLNQGKMPCPVKETTNEKTSFIQA